MLLMKMTQEVQNSGKIERVATSYRKKCLIFPTRAQDLTKRSADFKDHVKPPEPLPSMCTIDNCKVLCKDLEEDEIDDEILKLDLEVRKSSKCLCRTRATN